MRRHTLLAAALAVVLAALPVYPARYEVRRSTWRTPTSASPFPSSADSRQVRGKFTDFTVEIVYDDKDVTKSTVQRRHQGRQHRHRHRAARRAPAQRRTSSTSRSSPRSPSRARASRRRGSSSSPTAPSRCTASRRRSRCRSPSTACKQAADGKTTLGVDGAPHRSTDATTASTSRGPTTRTSSATWSRSS